ncbi:MAG TPA: hypothetical protein VJB99_01595 [Patescibacteria group bacterium]|nr:hypothetical protein [Patescibacteria group bacterium]
MEKKHPDSIHWSFLWNEFDSLEETVEEIFARHGRTGSRSVRQMEREVMEEQERTEAAFHTETGEDGMEEWMFRFPEDSGRQDSFEPESWVGDPRPIRIILKDVQLSDDLYTRSSHWASEVFLWSGRRYVHPGKKNRDLFRVYLNACLVPVTIGYARLDEEDETTDPERVGRSYALAFSYLCRTLASLSLLARKDPDRAQIRFFLSVGEEIRCELERICSDLLGGHTPSPSF